MNNKENESVDSRVMHTSFTTWAAANPRFLPILTGLSFVATTPLVYLNGFVKGLNMPVGLWMVLPAWICYMVGTRLGKRLRESINRALEAGSLKPVLLTTTWISLAWIAAVVIQRYLLFVLNLVMMIIVYGFPRN